MKSKMQEPEIVTRKGKPVSVILLIEIYQEMLERLEDVDDIAWLIEARKKRQPFLQELSCESQTRGPSRRGRSLPACT